MLGVHAHLRHFVGCGGQGLATHDLDVEALSDAGVTVLAVPDPHFALVHLARAFYGDPSRELKVRARDAAHLALRACFTYGHTHRRLALLSLPSPKAA